jgi:hypothetical protein
MATANDTFTGADGTSITARNMDSGHSWTLHPTSSTAPTIVSNTMRSNGTDPTLYASITPATADYSVGLDATTALAGGYHCQGVWARLDTTLLTGIRAWWNGGNARWEVADYVAGVKTVIGNYAGDSPEGTPRTMSLVVTGTSASLLIGGVTRINSATTTITAAGSPGVQGGESASIYSDNWTFADAGGSVPIARLSANANNQTLQ